MKKDVFSLQELARKTGASIDDLAAWTRIKILKPAGYTDDKSPLFAAGSLENVTHIRRLQELGYSTDSIQKIVRKIGLPRDGHGSESAQVKDRYLTVGGLAERSGVSPRTIKHWEDKGILDPDMRTEGGFRLYPESYVYLCQLIRDLQLFGYTLEEIKAISEDVRSFLAVEADLEAFPQTEVEAKLAAMLDAVGALFDKMKLLREGIERWEDLLKKRRKDILSLQAKNNKRARPSSEESHA